MFKPEDFELPLEKQLRLRVIDKEVDECDDRDSLKEQLKSCAYTLMRYQHILAKITERQLKEELALFGIMDMTKEGKANGDAEGDN